MLWTKALFVRSRKHRYKDYLEQKYPYPTQQLIKLKKTLFFVTKRTLIRHSINLKDK
jgi:hypothetical protein